MSNTYKIAVMGGDGTGPEVAAEGVKVLKAAAEKFDFKLELTDFDYGGERYLRTGEVLPDNAVEELTKYDVIEDPRFKAVSESTAASFEALQASLIVPLIYQDKVIVIIFYFPCFVVKAVKPVVCSYPDISGFIAGERVYHII